MSLISRRLPCRSLTATLSSVLLTKQPSMVTCEELSGSKPSVFISQGKSGSSCFVFEMSFTPERDARPSCPSRGGHVRSAGFDRLSVGLDHEAIARAAKLDVAAMHEHCLGLQRSFMDKLAASGAPLRPRELMIADERRRAPPLRP